MVMMINRPGFKDMEMSASVVAKYISLCAFQSLQQDRYPFAQTSAFV